ncbi:hypothetical protein J6590_085429, partial [Homalodisca vitripennis]
MTRLLRLNMFVSSSIISCLDVLARVLSLISRWLLVFPMGQPPKEKGWDSPKVHTWGTT